MTILTAHPFPAPTRWLRPAISVGLFVLALLLAAWDAVADVPGPVTLSENAGQVCFARGAGGADLTVEFLPALGCLSSSCTERLEQGFSAEVVDGQPPEIAMTSRFVVRSRAGAGPCTADCGGVGAAVALLTDVPGGPYRLTLGGSEIGTLDTRTLEAVPGTRICFGRAPQ